MMRSARRKERLGDASEFFQLQEMHCGGCGRFLGLQAVVWGVVKIKCPNCKEWNTVDIRPDMG